MILLHKILLDNKIVISDFAHDAGLTERELKGCIYRYKECFTFNALKKSFDCLVDKDIISKDFDIGDLLNEVD